MKCNLSFCPKVQIIALLLLYASFSNCVNLFLNLYTFVCLCIDLFIHYAIYFLLMLLCRLGIIGSVLRNFSQV